MPLYEYRCSKCAETLEVMRKFSDPPLTEHEGCGGTLERLLSAPAFQLKGTGWYATDYAKSGAKPAPDAESKPGDLKSDESKAADSKAAESKSGDDKASGDKKAGGDKSESKTESKPAPAKAD
jgi:putative FmdB family regulatory protein